MKLKRNKVVFLENSFQGAEEEKKSEE